MSFVRSVVAPARTPAEVEDAQLLDSYIAGESAALAVIYRRFHRLLLLICKRRLHDWEKAEDVCQWTFLQLTRSAKSIRERSRLRAWLCTVASRRAKKIAAKEGKNRRWFESSCQLSNVSYKNGLCPEREVINQEQLEIIQNE